ncbi:hypothetical protein [Neptuniibacter caesariensis]|uniref:Asparagine synthetase domain-containing protein n=1 Tax=Neptuniibacter caesariensis TaxID=207954 RepID=A0A7U8C4T5_NEPCE|nr:hypothetical protein [Neptuniibacter caesariensis]EAR59929.1 hypothetical protein MED92_16000 [Oceanospirillum sp. MED92] [Neptuniibacter caesariensis]
MNYPSQWLISANELNCYNLDLIQKINSKYYLHFDKRTKFEQFNRNGDLIITLGAIVYPQELLNSEGFNFKEWLFSCVGCYCVIRCYNDDIEIYTDPAGLMNIYYGKGVIASSLSFFPQYYNDGVKDNFSLENDWFTGDVTPLRGVRYLMANHSLSLNNNLVSRFWPESGHGNLNWDVGVEKCALHIKETISLASSKYSCIASLTGGRDSRVILAACEQLQKKPEFFTLTGQGVASDDIDVVTRLRQKNGFVHRFLPIINPTVDDLHIYDAISGGYAVGARRTIISSLTGFRDKGLVHINGNLGAIGKCYYWPINADSHCDEKSLLSDFTSLSEDKISGIRTWLRSLPEGISDTDKCNLMYLEQRGGRWMGIGEGASSMIYSSFTPFASRQLFEYIRALPDSDLRKNDWHYDVTRVLSPIYADIRYSRSTHFLTKLIPKFLVRVCKSLKARCLK